MYLATMSGYKQSAIHGAADTANTQRNGSVAVSTAGTDELLSSMQIDAATLLVQQLDAIAIQPRMPGATDATPAAGDTFPLTVIATYVYVYWINRMWILKAVGW